MRQWRSAVRPGRLYVLIAASVMLLAAPDAVGQSSTDRASLRWSLPTTLPPGALAAVVRGDPNSPGQSTFLLSMPNGYRVPPHYHPSYEHLEVRKGTLLLGMGDQLDRKRTRALAAGHSETVPAGMPHFWIASGRTEVSLTFNGPYTITYLHREDAPRRQVFPFGY